MDSGNIPLPVGENILSIISSGSIDFTLISPIKKNKKFNEVCTKMRYVWKKILVRKRVMITSCNFYIN